MTIGEWSAAYLQWAYLQPTNSNPFFDADGSRANNGQSGPVFFVAGGYYTGPQPPRSYTVPGGRYLLIPLITVEYDNIDTIPPLSVSELRDAAALLIDTTSELHVVVDGVSVTNLFDHRESSPVFGFVLASADNLFTYSYGHPITGLNDPAVADGYWLMLQPLSAGPHQIIFGGTYGSPNSYSYERTDDITALPENSPPVADASATALRVIAPDGTNAVVTLDALRSTDPHREQLSYAWMEGASVLSMATVSTNILTVGRHVVSLVVSNQHLSATNTITIDVITAEDALNQFVWAVQSARLPWKTERPLVERLEEASQHLHRGHHKEGIHELKDFQSEVHEHLKTLDAALAESFIQFAQEIIGALRQQPPHPPGVLPNDAVVDGLSIGEWSAEWWKWTFAIPTNENPLLDRTGVLAHNGQPDGSVFFLAGVFEFSGEATRAFSVEEDKYLFFPLVNNWDDNVYVDPPATVAEMKAFNASLMDAISEIHASIDGIAVPDLLAHRAISPVFSFFYETTDNIESFGAGQPVQGLDDPIVGEGFWLMVEPLPPGVHVINFGGTFGQPSNLAIDITDTITVVAIPLTERVKQLVSLVETSNLAAKARKDLLEELREAEKRFGQDHLEEAIEELREFQKKAAHQVAPVDRSLAQQLIQTAQTIIDKAKSARNLGRKNL